MEGESLGGAGRSIGTDSATYAKFTDLRYHIGLWTGAPGEAEDDRRYFAARTDTAAALLEAAVYELELTGDAAVEGASFDVELWQHVRHSVDEGRWEQVASQAVIFVEDKVRRWSGHPKGKNGHALVGQPLFGKALADEGPLALGAQRDETAGWRSLGTGLAAAAGNVDRHSIQDRPDARQYAVGVLGLASLLLTQLR